MSSTSMGRGIQHELEHGAAVVLACVREGLDVKWEHDRRDERGHADALPLLETALREQHVQNLLIEAEVQLHLRDLFLVGKMCHKSYDVVRAQQAHEVAGLEPRKWAALAAGVAYDPFLPMIQRKAKTVSPAAQLQI